MPEAEAVVAGKLTAVGSDELPAHECGEPRCDVFLVGERLNRAAVEDLAFDRTALEYRALGPLELVEPSCKQRL